MSLAPSPRSMPSTAAAAPVAKTKGDLPMKASAPQPLLLRTGHSALSAFALDPRLLHVNHGSFGAVPRRTLAHQAALRDQMEQAPVTWFGELAGRITEARASVARFLRVDVGSMAFVQNASAGASVVYNSLKLDPGTEVLVTNHGYGSVTMGAERMARRDGATVRTVDIPVDADEQAVVDLVTAAVTERTGLIVLDHATSPTARLFPVRQVARFARSRGVPVLVDGAHVPGLDPAPLEDLDCDFWIGNLHKFACAPRGTAVLIARGEPAQQLRPLIDSWGAQLPFPDRFDSQGTVDSTAWLSAPESLAFVEEEWGWDVARSHIADLADYAERCVADAMSQLTGEQALVDVGMKSTGLRLVRLPGGLASTPESAGALSVRLREAFDMQTAVTTLNGVGYLRLSAHVYNTAADYEFVAERAVPALVEWSR